MGTCVLFVYTCKYVCSCVYLAVLTNCLAICLFPICWFFSFIYTYWINDFWFLIPLYIYETTGQLLHLAVGSTKWDVAVHGRDLYPVKPTLGPPNKFQPLTRAEEVVITRLRIGHTKATKSHILSRGPPTGCHHCGQTLTIDHMLLESALLQESRDEY